jgi:predicted RNase H-like HicB family nuclease
MESPMPRKLRSQSETAQGVMPVKELQKELRTQTEPAKKRSEYLRAALRKKKTKQLEDGTLFAWIPGFRGVYANASTSEACREELAEVLEEWVDLKLSWNEPAPIVQGIDLNSR